MKIGIISDVHSNIFALEETFKKFKEQKVDKVICIGDVIGIGPYPEKCIQFLMNNRDMILLFIRGNHENYLLKGITRKNHNEEDAKPMSDEQISMHLWNHSKLNNEQIEFIRNLEDRESIEIEGKKIVIEHYPMDVDNKFKRFIKRPTQKQIEELFEHEKADVYLFGHTHQRHYSIANGKHYINPGSLGCPINSKGINAGILEISENKIIYNQLEIEYNIEEVINDIRKINYPLCEHIIDRFYKTN